MEDDDNMFRFDYRWVRQSSVVIDFIKSLLLHQMLLNCSPEFIGWALQPPGWIKEWHCGVRRLSLFYILQTISTKVRVAKSNKLVGFISAVPAHVRIYTKSKQMVSEVVPLVWMNVIKPLQL